ncbi:hypothetical protein IFR05_015836 [Cadophora sp. M221]|nr:hypothetical protein IFR05_015836 [Cadophora sp. M221]
MQQRLPVDLDSDEYYGRDHIQFVMGLEAHTGGSKPFIELAEPFLMVITHSAILDCLAVDTVVGGIFGSNGSRAIPFFQGLCGALLDAHFENGSELNTYVEKVLGPLVRAIHEVLRRQSRALFNDDLPSLLDSMMGLMEAVNTDTGSAVF